MKFFVTQKSFRNIILSRIKNTQSLQNYYYLIKLLSCHYESYKSQNYQYLVELSLKILIIPSRPLKLSFKNIILSLNNNQFHSQSSNSSLKNKKYKELTELVVPNFELLSCQYESHKTISFLVKLLGYNDFKSHRNVTFILCYIFL